MRARVTSSGDNPDFRLIRSEFRNLDGPGGKAVDELSRKVLREARIRVPVKSGTLLASLRRQVGVGPNGPYWDVIAGVPGLTNYLGYVLFGTRPHEIKARRRKALRFVQNGQVRFARRVWHPGTAADNFLKDALDTIR